MKPTAATLACLALLACTAAWAETGLGRLHSFKDWVLGCDNTRQCEAQGYGSEAEGAPPGGRAALIVRRDAGPARAPTLTFAFSRFGDTEVPPPPRQPIRLQAGALRLRLAAIDERSETVDVPPADVPALMAAVLRAEHILLSAGQAQWSVSLAGASAALLKMDDLQGRLGTPGALVRKGTKTESAVPAPQAPTVQAAMLPPTTPADLKLEPRLRVALPRSGDDCPDFDPTQALDDLVRLTPTRLLVLQPCWRGAYQTGSRVWQVDDKPPHRARPIKLPGPDGTEHDTLVVESITMNSGTLELHEAAKGRGIGDCWRSINWTWTGERMALLDATQSACKAFEAGGLMIPLWRTQGR